MKHSEGTDKPRVAVIDDEPIACREIKRALAKDSYHVETFPDGESALIRLKTMSFDVVLCDLRLPGRNGLEVLKEIKKQGPQVEVIIITAYSSVDTAVDAIKAGAFHYLTKPIKMPVLRGLVGKVMEKVRLIKEKDALKKALFSRGHHLDLIGGSRPIQDVHRLIEKVAPLNCNVIIQGETGTGKEIVARIIHFKGARKDQPFISFNCGGFTEELIANELFGHEKGAFTGAVDTRIGLLEASNRGTVFLDEIGEMPPSMQVKLLRFVQERTLLRVGGIRPIPVDVRLIAASNQDLREEVKNRRFREDLFYRLNVMVILLPPLRSRKGDIPLLIRHFLDQYSHAFGKEITGIDPEASEILLNYPFPGNVRELENIIERAVALGDGTIVRTRDLPTDLQELSMTSLENHEWPSLEDKEREYVRRVLVKTHFKKGLAAEILKIPRTTLWRKMKRLGLG